MSPTFKPHSEPTDAMRTRVREINVLIRHWLSVTRKQAQRLRRFYQLRAIHASLAIDGNTLSVEQLVALVSGHPVDGSPRDIQEAMNAVAAQAGTRLWSSSSREDLVIAHRLMMQGLANDAGRLRRAGAVIVPDGQLARRAPSPAQMSRRLNQLLEWLRYTDVHPLLAASAAHCEIACIQPFGEGNGRIARLWQTQILIRWFPVLGWLPVETVLLERRHAYDRALAEADAAGDDSGFIAFMLDAIATTLQQEIDASTSTAIPPGVLSRADEARATARRKCAARIVALLEEHPELTMLEVAARLDEPRNAVQSAVVWLRKDGRLRYVGSQWTGHWEVAPQHAAVGQGA